MSAVAPGQRFTSAHPCPVCKGFDGAPRGRGERCFGFLSDDSEYAHCSREELSGGLRFEQNSETFAHRLTGACRCGTSHDPSPAPVKASKRTIETIYDYVDQYGALLHQVIRYRPKSFSQRRPVGNGGWVWSLDGVQRVPYRLPELLQADEVFVCEGEQDCDLLAGWNLAATCNSGGAGKWLAGYSEFLRGKRVVIIPDADEPGRGHALDVAHSLLDVAAEVRIVELSGAKDVSEWVARDGSHELLVRLAQDAEALTKSSWEKLHAEWLPAQAAAAETKTSRSTPTQKDLLLELAATTSLFRTPDGAAFADIDVNGHRETWPVRSERFKGWLNRRYYEVREGAPSREARESALDTLQAKARFDSPEQPVALRVAEHKGKLYLDLCDEAWRAVEIGPASWRVVDRPPVRFRRTPGMKALPLPVAGGSIDELRPFLNVSSDGDFVLAVAWMLAALRPNGPFPVLVLLGEQGSAKSTFAKILRSLVDPSGVPLRSLPRSDRDLFIGADNAHVQVFDNISGLQSWVSDSLCRLSTGGQWDSQHANCLRTRMNRCLSRRARCF